MSENHITILFLKAMIIKICNFEFLIYDKCYTVFLFIKSNVFFELKAYF